MAEAQTYPELTLSTPLPGHRLMARFDLLAHHPDGSFLIIDWKTTQRKPPRPDLARRIQTRVYPYVLATAGSAFNGGQAIDPAAISMLYWYPQAPDQPERFEYGPGLFEQDRQFLAELVERVKAAAAEDDFPKVPDDKPCTYCVYRSFCDRGVEGGPLVELTEDLQQELDLSALDWDQIAEIQF